MKARHHITVRARCPANNDHDEYAVVVFVDGRMLPCEEVVAAIDDLTREPVFQEAFTQALANRLVCVVQTRGTHCQGRVETVCTCRPGGGK